MEDEGVQRLASEQEFWKNESNTSFKLEEREEVPGAVESFQEEEKWTDSAVLDVEEKTSDALEANGGDDKMIFVNVRGESGIRKEKIQTRNLYEMISYEIYRSNGVEKDFPIDLCLDVQEDIDNIMPFLQKSIANKRNK